MVVCIHDNTRMRSNPYTTSDLFWCPRCGGHDYKSVSRNGKLPRLVDVQGKLARVDSPEARNPGGIGRITAKDRGRFRVDSSEFPGQEVTGWWLIDELTILDAEPAPPAECGCVLPEQSCAVCWVPAGTSEIPF